MHPRPTAERGQIPGESVPNEAAAAPWGGWAVGRPARARLVAARASSSFRGAERPGPALDAPFRGPFGVPSTVRSALRGRAAPTGDHHGRTPPHPEGSRETGDARSREPGDSGRGRRAPQRDRHSCARPLCRPCPQPRSVVGPLDRLGAGGGGARIPLGLTHGAGLPGAAQGRARGPRPAPLNLSCVAAERDQAWA